MTSVRQTLIQSINDTDILTQADLNQIFAQARFLINECLAMLCHVSYAPHLFFIDQAMTVLAGTDRNRAIYKKPAAFDEKDVVDYSKEGNVRVFLCSSMDMMTAILRNNVTAQKKILVSNNVSRSVSYSNVNNWLQSVKNYDTLSWESASALLEGDDDVFCSREINLSALESESSPRGGDSSYYFGVYRYVSQRMKAVDHLYGNVLKAYSRIVLKIATMSAGSEAQSNDSFQDGCFGLMRAVQSYDHCSFIHFSNFARWWIRQSVLFHLKDKANLIHIPISTWQHFNNLEKVREVAEGRLGNMSPEVLAQAAGVSVDHVKKVYSTISLVKVASLSSAGASKNDPQKSFLVEKKVKYQLEKKEDSQKKKEAMADTSRYLDCLTENERRVVCLCFGIFDQLTPQPISETALQTERFRQQNVAHKLSLHSQT